MSSTLAIRGRREEQPLDPPWRGKRGEVGLGPGRQRVVEEGPHPMRVGWLLKNIG
jgi:hypothetical protein